jgi:hypothetical protein
MSTGMRTTRVTKTGDVAGDALRVAGARTARRAIVRVSEGLEVIVTGTAVGGVRVDRQGEVEDPAPAIGVEAVQRHVRANPYRR